MAYIEENDKLQENQDPNQQQSVGGSGAPSIVNQGSNAVGSGVNTAGVGAGGTGKWTNIQAYLEANKNVDTGAKDLLESNVGGQFEKEKSDLGQEAQKLKTDAKQASSPVDDVWNNSQKYIDDAAGAYSFGGQSGDPYNKAVNSFQNALTAKYTGPNSYAKEISGKAQQYNSALGDDNTFNQLLGDMYQNKAGGQLSSGGRALQTQLNISNEPLSMARKNLLDKYQGLNSYRDQTVKDTNTELANTAQNFGQRQNSIKDFLSNKSSEYDSKTAQQEADAKKAYNDLMASKSGYSSVGYGALGAGPTDRRFGWQEQAAGVYGDNLSWNDLAKAEKFYRPLVNRYAPYDGGWVYADAANDRKNAYDTLQNRQLEKYQSTADAEKRRFNIIQDILKSNAARKKDGFDVRS